MSIRRMSSGGLPAVEQPSVQSIYSNSVCSCSGFVVGAPTMCKLNSAAYVKTMVPDASTRMIGHSGNIGKLTVSCEQYAFDKQDIEAYLDLRTQMGARDAQAASAGSEDPGVGARRDAQFQSRRDPRSVVHREPVLRSQGPGPGALRDGATTRRRRYVRQRSGCIIRGLSANLLQGSEHTGYLRTGRPRATFTRAKGRPQDLQQCGGLRHRSQREPTRIDHATVSCCHRGTVRRQGASTQFGARADAQKKSLGPPLS
jgi:hypothetical protein